MLVGALVALMGAAQAWLAVRSVQHSSQMNGAMETRITAGAEKAIASYHAAVHEPTTLNEPAKPRRFTPSTR